MKSEEVSSNGYEPSDAYADGYETGLLIVEKGGVGTLLQVPEAFNEEALREHWYEGVEEGIKAGLESTKGYREPVHVVPDR